MLNVLSSSVQHPVSSTPCVVNCSWYQLHCSVQCLVLSVQYPIFCFQSRPLIIHKVKQRRSQPQILMSLLLHLRYFKVFIQLRKCIKHPRQCFIHYSSISNSVKNTSLQPSSWHLDISIKQSLVFDTLHTLECLEFQSSEWCLVSPMQCPDCLVSLTDTFYLEHMMCLFNWFTN